MCKQAVNSWNSKKGAKCSFELACRDPKVFALVPSVCAHHSCGEARHAQGHLPLLSGFLDYRNGPKCWFMVGIAIPCETFQGYYK